MGAMNKVFIYISIISLMGVLFVFYGAHRSKIFYIDNYELSFVGDLKPAPLFYEEIQRKGFLSDRNFSLFSVSFLEIEKNISLHPWIKNIELKKEVPSRLKIEIELKKPIAVFQSQSGDLFYLDESGSIISAFSIKRNIDLPVIYGVTLLEKEKINTALSIIKAWDNESVNKLAKLSSLSWRTNAEWVGVALVELKDKKSIQRLSLLWQERELSTSQENMKRFKDVLGQISSKKMEVSQILFVSDKKIVVRSI